ncbi:ATP-binding cassette domain-containing protein [Micromonospora sp. NPDC018662]|uniref:ATP-binding cassette domain-containing protein n=1 Tax=Micromonospora sp. NPDC018662 TaxID=3364238 RepID=UPI0037A64965
MSYAFEAEGLVKRFGSTTALAGIDLAARRGTVLGVLGPNGAGKTTAVRILATLLRPDEGRATVGGHDVVADAGKVRRLIGLTGQYASVDEDLTGTQNLVLIGRLLDLSGRDARAGRRAGDPVADLDRGDHRGLRATGRAGLPPPRLTGRTEPGRRPANAGAAAVSPSRVAAHEREGVGPAQAAPPGVRGGVPVVAQLGPQPLGEPLRVRVGPVRPAAQRVGRAEQLGGPRVPAHAATLSSTRPAERGVPVAAAVQLD